MHVKAKQMAFLGLLAAIVEIFIILGSILETNTFFLLAAASYLVGVAIREFGFRLGAGFFLACLLLSFLLSPNKLYALTYSGLSLYILCIDGIYLFLTKDPVRTFRKTVFYGIKFVLFNAMYIPVLILLPELLFAGGLKQDSSFFFLLAAGQVGWLIYDKAYDYFQVMVWGKLRRRITLLQ